MNTGSSPQNDLRQTLYSAYAFVRSMESNAAVAGLTLDHLINQQILALNQNSTTPILDSKGTSMGDRVSRYDQLTKLGTDIQNVVNQIKAAGNDRAKLAAIGIFELDGVTNAADQAQADAIRQQLLGDLKSNQLSATPGSTGQ